MKNYPKLCNLEINCFIQFRPMCGPLTHFEMEKQSNLQICFVVLFCFSMKNYSKHDLQIFTNFDQQCDIR